MDTTSKLVVALIGLGLAYGVAVWQREWLAKMHTFLGEAKVELKKVTWPGRKETISTTSVVVVAVFVFGVFLTTADAIFTWVQTQLFSAVGL